MKHTLKRILSAAMVLILLCGLLPVSVLAAETGDQAVEKQLVKLVRNDGITVLLNYNESGRLVRKAHYDANGEVQTCMDLSYDAANRLTCISLGVNDWVDFLYSETGELSEIVSHDSEKGEIRRILQKSADGKSVRVDVVNDYWYEVYYDSGRHSKIVTESYDAPDYRATFTYSYDFENCYAYATKKTVWLGFVTVNQIDYKFNYKYRPLVIKYASDTDLYEIDYFDYEFYEMTGFGELDIALGSFQDLKKLKKDADGYPIAFYDDDENLLCELEWEAVNNANDSGKCGENAYWEYDAATRTLTISGEGEIANPDWDEYFIYDMVDDLVIEEGITKIGDGVFWGVKCDNLCLPESLLEIGHMSFNSCDIRNVFDLPNGLKHIGDGAFCYSSLKKIDIPASVVSIGDGAFEGSVDWQYDRLEQVTLHEGLQTIGSHAFCFTAIEEVDLPKSLVALGQGAFWGTELESVVIPPNVSEIKFATFYSCGRLTSVVIPAAVTRIGEQAFAGCDSLSEVYFTGTEEQWNAIAIAEGNECLTRITPVFDYVPDANKCGDNVYWQFNEAIGTLTISGEGDMWDYDDDGEAPWAFLCGEIRTVVVEEGVSRIGNHAFCDCGVLQTVSFQGKLPSFPWDGKCFEGVTAICYYPYGNVSWDGLDKKSYGGNLIWVAVGETVEDTTPNMTGTYNGHTYEVYNIPMQWTDAKAFCEAKGGHLVTLTTAEENIAVNKLLTGGIKNNYWIGLYREENADVWKWVGNDGTLMGLFFNNWSKKEPNNDENSKAGEHYVHLFGVEYTGPTGIKKLIGQWNDVSNDGASYAGSFYELQNFGLICEYDYAEGFEESYTDQQWIEAHQAYVLSTEFKSEVVQGFSGQLQSSFEEIRDDRSIDAYNTLDAINTILEFDLDLSDSQEYELLLAQILFRRVGVESIEEAYDEYFPAAMIQLADVVFDGTEFVAGLDEEQAAQIKQLVSKLKNLVQGTEEFNSVFDDLLKQMDALENAEISKEAMAGACESANFTFAFELFTDQYESTCDSFKQMMLYMAAAEAYCDTSVAFEEMLLEMRRHIAVPSNDSRFAPYDSRAVGNQKLWSVLGVDMVGTGTENILACPVYVKYLAEAIERFYISLEDARDGKAGTIAAMLATDYLESTMDNLIDAEMNVALSFFECIPVVKGFTVIRDLFDGTQFVIDTFTTYDDRAYSGTMVKRLYAVAYIHYLTVEEIARKLNSGVGVELPLPGGMLKSESELQRAVMFDEAVAVYRSILSVGADYAIKYHTAQYNNGIRVPEHSALNRLLGSTEANEKILMLKSQQTYLKVDWCHRNLLSPVDLTPSIDYKNPNLLIYSLKCPIEVTVTDPAGTVIAVLNDERSVVAEGYAEYFYVTEIEKDSGEYLKLFVVPDDYSVEFVGVGEGEMDVIVSDYTNEVLGESRGVQDVAITVGLKGEFVDSSDGETAKELVVDGAVVETNPIVACTEHIPAVVAGKAATCEEDGLTDGSVCEKCDAVLVEQQVIPALGHEWDDGKVTKEPTEEAEGEKLFTCTECGKTKNETIDKVNPITNPFEDVFDTDYYYEPVLWAVENGITSGTSATTFAPGQDCTRGQVVTFLWRAKGQPEPTTTDNPFVDISEGDYYYKAVLWAKEQGITGGTSATTFAPDAPCTRGQVATFLWRALGKPTAENTENSFGDVTEGTYYYDAVLWAVEAGVTTGVGNGCFAPDDTCTRGQIVTFLYRALANQ